jgi:hypothetical protein
MIKISQKKIVRSAVGSARLEGYKGSLKAPSAKKAALPCPKAKSEIKSKR